MQDSAAGDKKPEKGIQLLFDTVNEAKSQISSLVSEIVLIESSEGDRYKNDLINAWQATIDLFSDDLKEFVAHYDISKRDGPMYERLFQIFSKEFDLPSKLDEASKQSNLFAFVSSAFAILPGGAFFIQVEQTDLAFSLAKKSGIITLDAPPLSDLLAAEICEAAQSDHYCLELARGWIVYYLRTSQVMPIPLSKLNIRLLNGIGPKFKAGRKRNLDQMRNLAIKLVSEIAVRKFGVPLDRNPATKADSVAKVISDALLFHRQGISETAVSKIARRPWSDFAFGEFPVAQIAKALFPTT